MTMKDRMNSEELELVENVPDLLIHVESQSVTSRSRLLNLGHSEESIDKFIKEGIYTGVEYE